MSERNPSVRGFTLIEVMTVVLVLGLLIGFSIPAFQVISQSHSLKGATENMLGQLRLSRQKAIGEDRQQRWTFSTATNSYNVQDLTSGRTFGPFKVAKGITMESVAIVVSGVTGDSVTVLTDGRFSGSGEIVLKDRRGNRDTLSIQRSGLVLAR